MLTSIRRENGSVADVERPGFESAVTKSYPAAGRADLVIADESAAAKTIVKASPGTPVASALGVAFGSSRRGGDVLVSGQRPGEWLLIGVHDAVGALLARLDTSGHVSTVDQTHGQALFRLTGERAASTLEKLCSLDWSDQMTPDGAAASASVAKVNCDLIRDDADGTPSYLIACDRSYGQYLFDAIVDAGDEFAVGVAR